MGAAGIDCVCILAQCGTLLPAGQFCLACKFAHPDVQLAFHTGSKIVALSGRASSSLHRSDNSSATGALPPVLSTQHEEQWSLYFVDMGDG